MSRGIRQVNFEESDRGEQKFQTEPTFGTKIPLQQNPTDMKEIRPMERDLEMHQQEPTEAEEVRKLEKESYTPFGEEGM